jgi:glucuronate isomerase
MARPFIDENFLLSDSFARELYHSFAGPMPIIDFHGHLPAVEIAADRRFENLTRLWLAGDHYKWRAMRTAGVEERFITGDAADRDKFLKWAETVPQTLGNPLYHWTHLELNRCLGITDRRLGPDTAAGIWEEGRALLAGPEFSARGILRKMNVEVLCTTDDPADSLENHAAMQAEPDLGFKVFPTFRPDKALAVENPAAWAAYLRKLGEAAGMEIQDWRGFVEALGTRHDFFHDHGCRISDHGLEAVVADDYQEADLADAFRRIRAGSSLAPHSARQFKSAVLHELAVMDAGRGWVQQFHLGALRNINSRMRSGLGADAGFDGIGDFEQVHPLARFLDRLDSKNKLAKTIVYNLNPRDNEAIAVLLGAFQDGSLAGKMQWGAAWWFLDQKDGITRHIEVLSNMGLLSRFVGMVTDSRSFLSFPRHEYFRRILCGRLGREMEEGRLPHDIELIGNMVRGICGLNARRYFDF